jgi:chromosomal replication initiator protein
MSETSRRGFFRTIAAGIAVLAASRAAIALPVPAAPLPRGARTHAALKEMLGEDKYLSWFYAMRVGDCDGCTLQASVPVKFIKNWIDHHYAADLLAAARTEFVGVQEVELIARGTKPTRLPV